MIQMVGFPLGIVNGSTLNAISPDLMSQHGNKQHSDPREQQPDYRDVPSQTVEKLQASQLSNIILPQVNNYDLGMCFSISFITIVNS